MSKSESRRPQFFNIDSSSQRPFGFLGEAAPAFYCRLFLLSGSTMIYEVMLARLLSVVTWYYLALAAVGMTMSGVIVLTALSYYFYSFRRVEAGMPNCRVATILLMV